MCMFFTPPTNLSILCTPSRYPTIQVISDTNYLERGQIPQVRAQVHKTPHTSDASFSPSKVATNISNNKL